MKNYLILAIAISLIACTNNQTDDISPKNVSERMYFENANEFMKTLNELSENQSKQELSEWANAKAHQSLLDSKDSTIVDYSDALKTILNKNAEFEQGDSIIWFKAGNFYAIPKTQENNLKKLKDESNDQYKIGCVEIKKYKGSHLKQLTLNNNQYDARNQYRFGNFKYVHGISAEAYSYWGLTTVSLYLDVKLEWKARKWRYTDEPRKITIDCYIDIRRGLGTPRGFYLNQSLRNTHDQHILLERTQESLDNNPWYVSVNGKITQEIEGQPSSLWINEGQLW